MLCFLALPSGGSTVGLVSGAKLWSVRYDGPGHGEDLGNDIAFSPDATKVFVTGFSDGGPADDYVTVAYNAATGTSLWTRRYNGPGNGTDNPTSIAVSGDGTKVFVTGGSYGGSTTGDAFATVAYNASTGAQLWVKRYNGPVNGLDSAVAVAVRASRVFVTGYSYGGSTTDFDYATLAYDASSGAQLWAARYNGPLSAWDSAKDLAVSADGTKVFVTGNSVGGSPTSNDVATVAYGASTGAKLWATRYNGPGNAYDNPHEIAVSPAGTRVFVIGETYSIGSTTGFDFITIAYSASTGSTSWTSRYNGPVSGNDYGTALAVSGDGTKLFVAGTSYGGSASERDYVTIAYSSGGGKLWSMRYNGPGNGLDLPRSVGVDPGGTKVFVTGDSDGGVTDYEGTTLAYNTSTGSKLWAARYDGPGSGYDGFFSLAVASDGTKVAVTGETYAGSTTGYDLVTAVYQP